MMFSVNRLCTPYQILFFAYFCLVLLSGCGTVPKDAGFADVQEQVSKRQEQSIHWKRGTPEDAAVDAAIQELLNRPLSLADVIQVALLNNPALQSTYENLGIAQADLVQAGLLENPVFGASVRFPDRDRSGSKTTTLTSEGTRGVSVSRSRGNTPASIMRDASRNASLSRSSESSAIRNNIEFSLVQNFLDLLTLPLRKRLAESQFELEKLRVSHEVLMFTGEVKHAYYEYVATRQIAEMHGVVTTATGAASEFAVRQYEAGNLSKLEMARENAFHAQALLSAAQAELAVRLARERMNRLMGMWEPQLEWTLADSRLNPPTDSSVSQDGLVAFAIANRLDLAATVKELEILVFGLESTRRWRWLGLLDLTVSSERDGDGVYVTGPALELELPIFDRGQAKVARAESETRAGSQRVSSLAIDVRADTREAWEKLSASRDVVDYFERVLLPAHEMIVGEAQLHYNAMLIGVYDLLLDKQHQIETGAQYIEALRDYWLSRTELEMALGGALDTESVAPSAPAAVQEHDQMEHAEPEEAPAESPSPVHEHH